jgi:hypothetical protein
MKMSAYRHHMSTQVNFYISHCQNKMGQVESCREADERSKMYERPRKKATRQASAKPRAKDRT